MQYVHLSAEWDVAGEESGEKQLWEENWDDDDVEDDFSRQLRWAITDYALHIPTGTFSPHSCRAELERVGQLGTQTEPMKS